METLWKRAHLLVVVSATPTSGWLLEGVFAHCVTCVEKPERELEQVPKSKEEFCVHVQYTYSQSFP